MKYARAVVLCSFVSFACSLYSTHRVVSLDDDEIHDEEIFKAVTNSIFNFYGSNRTRVKRGIKMVCYGVLGCFRDEGVFDYLDMVPAPPEEINTKFMVFTRGNHEPDTLVFDNYTRIGVTSFNASNPTKFIIHGFGSTCNRMWASEMRQALLAVLDCNVICVDWENGAAIPNYVRAAVNTRLVGKQLSLLINWLNTHHGSKNSDFHLIGFSLGAHVAGFTGSELKNLSRITGLDPAGPLFQSYDAKVRLDSSDAEFVDVIHSNGDNLLMGGLGYWEPIGHLDFYPNGGRAQKGCSHLFLGAFRDLIWSPGSSGSVYVSKSSPSPSRMRVRMLQTETTTTTAAPETDGRSLCNHRRAYKFFTESVSPRCQFPAFFCDSFDKYLTGVCFHTPDKRVKSFNMGYYADVGFVHETNAPVTKENKLLFLATRDNEPFCANQYRVRVESSASPAPISTYGGLEAILYGGNDNHELVNETFLITLSPKDNMIAGSVLQRLLIAHPALTTPMKINLKYTAYQGWWVSGISRWSMDRIIVTDHNGVSYSFCTPGLLLPSGISVTVTLNVGICVPRSVHRNPNLPNYPYETFVREDVKNLTTLHRLMENSSSWVPINGSSSPPPNVTALYVTKTVLPDNIDNLLHELEVTGPSSDVNTPTRLLLGTTRSLNSRPIVLRNRVREGRGLSKNYLFLVPTPRKRLNNEFIRQIGINMDEYSRKRKSRLVALRRKKIKKI